MSTILHAEQLAARREPFVRATVVRAQRPTSAHAGDTALILGSGVIDGFVGGACVEASVRTYGLQVLASREPLLLRVVPGPGGGGAAGSTGGSVTADAPAEDGAVQDGAVQVTNPCLSGGTIEIFLEPQIPLPRIIVVGATPVAQALAALGSALGFDAVLTDGAAAAPLGDDAALIVASHGREEEPALSRALRAGVPYVALVASRTRGRAVLDSLDVTDEQRAQVVSPAGLDLGARTAAEIALSVFAQLVQLRAAARAHDHSGPAPVRPAPSYPSPDAIDPVCGMSVAAVPASIHLETETGAVYFCSDGCRTAYVTRGAPLEHAT
ncbi:hypothetical protein D6T64_22015 [Cryobacterium melibiosiphilum]|uniref:YHS domain-containing protein n=1 Tax=Cryobacterium melibiosiphilum TaxID=995039 RepID=A0A3A5MGY1_9MICO|nr:XdhC family protein [Cryobacterium melibiosiphilum]RJT84816.1 hypothetical protein D6T64_22015 [Cryobacterium melibiosiphilum]